MRSLFTTSAVLGLCLATLAASAAPAASTAPDFSGIWWHPSLPGIEPLASGPTSLKNRSRANGVSNYSQLVGDYENPILKPAAAATVKKFGELSVAGKVFPSPANQCWPEPVPYIYKNFGLQLLQKSNEIVMLYEQDHEVRRVRMNAQHPRNVKPSWYGDSIGRYEGDTLVIDTIGTRTDRPFPMIDLYGTPYTKSLHIVERYKIVSYEEAKDGLDRDAKENMQVPVGIDRSYRGKHLQLTFTVEDEGVFTTQWTATVTFGRGSNDWPEIACAENSHVYYDQDEKVPTAAKPDF